MSGLSKKEIEGDLSEQATATTTSEIDVYVMVFATDRFFHERLLYDFAVNDNSIPILPQSYFGCDKEPPENNTQPALHELHEVSIYFWTAISRDLEPFGSRHA